MMTDVDIRIAVCDDVETDRSRLADAIIRLTGHQNVRIRQFASGEELLTCPESWHIIFLDILMDGVDGMETARRLRERDGSPILIFVSSSPDFLAKGYEVEAFRYLLKPYRTADIAAVLDKAFARVTRRGLVFQAGGSVHRIPYADIAYIEARGRSCELHLTDGCTTTINEGITALEKRVMPESILRCQKSFLVNVAEIRRIRRYEVEMRDGSVVPIGRKWWPQVRTRLVEYCSLD